MKNIYSLESVWGKLLFIIVIFLHILLASAAVPPAWQSVRRHR